MDLSDVRRLYAYTDWANERLLETIAPLSDDQVTRAVVSSFPSIRDTLGHIAFAEWLWLQRWTGSSPLEVPEWTRASSPASLRESMQETAARRRAYIDGLTNHAIESTISYRSTNGDPFTMVLRDVLIHCANHSTYHRGQLVTMLRQVGVTPPSTEYTHFIRSQSA